MEKITNWRYLRTGAWQLHLQGSVRCHQCVHNTQAASATLHSHSECDGCEDRWVSRWDTGSAKVCPQCVSLQSVLCLRFPCSLRPVWARGEEVIRISHHDGGGIVLSVTRGWQIEAAKYLSDGSAGSQWAESGDHCWRRQYDLSENSYAQAGSAISQRSYGALIVGQSSRYAARELGFDHTTGMKLHLITVCMYLYHVHIENEQNN